MNRILLILCLFFAIPSMAQITVVDSTTHNDNPAVLANQTNAFSTLGASVIIAGVTDFATGVALGTVTDDQGNTYSQLFSVANATYRATFFGAKARNVSATTRITYTTASLSYSTVFGLSLAGVDTTSAYVDQTNGNGTGTVSSKQPGSITPTQNNEMVITLVNSAGGAGASSNPPTVSSPYITTGTTNWVSGAHFSGGMAQVIQSTATATNPTWTCAQNNTHVAIIMSLFATSAAVNDGGFLNW